MDVTELEFYIYRSVMVASASVLESYCLHAIPKVIGTIEYVADVHLSAQKHEQRRSQGMFVVPRIGELNLEAVRSLQPRWQRSVLNSFWASHRRLVNSGLPPPKHVQHHTSPNRPELQSLHRESPSLSTSPSPQHQLSQPQNGFQGESESPEHPRPALLQLVPNAKLHPPALGS